MKGPMPGWSMPPLVPAVVPAGRMAGNGQPSLEASGSLLLRPWAVVDGGTGTLLGRVALRRIDLTSGEAECSYWVLPGARQGGVATTATNRMVAWAFED